MTGCSLKWRIMVTISMATILSGGMAEADWKPENNTMMTRWAADVRPERTHAEYPRPQLVRADWQSLNGLYTAPCDEALRYDLAVLKLDVEQVLPVHRSFFAPVPVIRSVRGILPTSPSTADRPREGRGSTWESTPSNWSPEPGSQMNEIHKW